MLLLMRYDYDHYNIIMIISFVITIHQFVAKLIVRNRVMCSSDREGAAVVVRVMCCSGSEGDVQW